MMKKTLALVCAGVMSAVPMMASAYEAGDMMLRFGGVAVTPQDESENIPDVDAPVGVGSDTQVGLNFVYMLTSNVGVEVLAATPFQHDVTLKNSAMPSTIGSVKHLPPTVSLQYYFNTNSNFTPYIGAGLNYTTFFSEDVSKLEAANPGMDFDLSLDDSTGLALQVGVDYKITDHWALNASMYKIDIDTEATLKVDGDKLKWDIEIDPMVYMVAASYKF